MARSIVQEFTKGLWDEIPPFRLVLGLCPVLAVTKSVENGIGMGVATTFVLVCSNVLVSSLRKVIPAKVRIACYIVIIATFVTVVELVMQAFAYPLFLKLGIFIPLIVVNCIVLGRSEAFASKNGIFRSLLDGRVYPVAQRPGGSARTDRNRRFDDLGKTDRGFRAFISTVFLYG
jgi:electron transport complex protein RnfE